MLTWILLFALVATCVAIAVRADKPQRHLAVGPALLGGAMVGFELLVGAAPEVFGRRPESWLPIVVVVGLAGAVALGLYLLNVATTARLTRLANEALGEEG